MGNARILIVDDDADIRDSLQAMLERRQYSVVTAGDREEGMAKIRSERPDLVILDLMMATWQDGFEMARELKQYPEFEKIPILMLTGAKDKTGIDFKSTAGDPSECPVDGFLDKPVDAGTLVPEIERLLSARA